MTAGLGSEYRYFGKLVLVPFRYFSIDIYRNIDIFDNTTADIITSGPFLQSLALTLIKHSELRKNPDYASVTHSTQIKQHNKKKSSTNQSVFFISVLRSNYFLAFYFSPNWLYVCEFTHSSRLLPVHAFEKAAHAKHQYMHNKQYTKNNFF